MFISCTFKSVWDRKIHTHTHTQAKLLGVCVCVCGVHKIYSLIRINIIYLVILKLNLFFLLNVKTAFVY